MPEGSTLRESALALYRETPHTIIFPLKKRVKMLTTNLNSSRAYVAYVRSQPPTRPSTVPRRQRTFKRISQLEPPQIIPSRKEPQHDIPDKHRGD